VLSSCLLEVVGPQFTMIYIFMFHIFW